MINLSNHVKERYAERIMGYDNPKEIQQFIATHEEKINTDIEKMIQYGDVIYSGKSNNPKTPNKNMEVIMNGTWIVLRDADTKVIITLYSIDLGVGKEFNEAYATKIFEQMDAIKKKIEEARLVQQEEIDEYNKKIEDNEAQITAFRAKIKLLEEENQSYATLIRNYNESRKLDDDELRQIIYKMIGRKVL